MKIAICDDITECRLSIRSYVKEYFINHHIKAEMLEFDSGSGILESAESFDIVFLDIELGDKNGIEIAKVLQSKNPNIIILIVTSYRHYLDEAMDLNVTRYIDKPITQQRIFSALDKAISIIEDNIITLHSKDNRLIRLKMQEIVFAEAKLKKICVYTKNECFVIKESMKELRSVLTASCFAIPHNSYIVNLNYVRDYKRYELCLVEPYQKPKISIATRKQVDFKRKFLDFIGEECDED